MFYVNGVKIIPLCIEEYLSPLALAIWIMDDGCRASSGLKLATNSFTLTDIQFMCDVLTRKYGLTCSVNSAGVEGQYCISIHKSSMHHLASIVGPYIHPSMKYKLNNY